MASSNRPPRTWVLTPIPRYLLTPESSQGFELGTTPCRHFTIILTNNSELLRGMQALQQQEDLQLQETILTENDPNNNEIAIAADREQLLYNTLRVELREATREYLSRTQRSYPIHYVMDMSGIQPPS